MITDDSDDSKILESIFEPDNSEILTYLQNEPKTLSDLTKNLDMTKEKIDQCLSYLIKNDLIKKIERNSKIYYSVDVDNLSKVLENSDNFKNIDDGLAKLDSFLN